MAALIGASDDGGIGAFRELAPALGRCYGPGVEELRATLARFDWIGQTEGARFWLRPGLPRPPIEGMLPRLGWPSGPADP